MSSTRPAAPAVSDLTRLEEVCERARPVAVATDWLRSTVEEFRLERTRAVAALRRAVLNLGHDCPADARADLARVLYWRHREVPITDITVAFGFHDQSSLLAAVGPVTTEVACEDCGDLLLATTRRRLAELERLATSSPTRYGPRPRCSRCDERHERAIFAELPERFSDDGPTAWAADITS